MNILAVTYCVPPMATPATIRLIKWFNGLTDMGHHLDVLAIDPHSFSGFKDATLHGLMPASGIKQHLLRPGSAGLLYRLMQKQERLFYRFLQPGAMSWYYPALKQIRLLDFKTFDLLFTCSSPNSSHLIGRRIKRATGLPWVAYFSDPWSDNPLNKYGSRKIHEYNRQLEADVIAEADRLIFTTRETLDLVMAKYDERHLEKCRILPHCFVPQWYSLGKADILAPGSKIRILHAGAFYSDRKALSFLKAVADVSKRGKRDLGFEVFFFGTLDQPSVEYIHDNNLENVVRFGGRASYLDSLALMKAADFLLLIDAPLGSVKESVFLPSKLIEYMGSGKPVIGITPRSGASARVLNETRNLLVDIENTQAIAHALESINSASLNVTPNASETGKYHYQQISRTLGQIFQELH